MIESPIDGKRVGKLLRPLYLLNCQAVAPIALEKSSHLDQLTRWRDEMTVGQAVCAVRHPQ